MYYKAILDGQIVDALEDIQCVRYFDKIGILRCRQKDQPEGIISSDGQNIWHVDGWPGFPEDSGKETVQLVEIDAVDYQAIREALDSVGGSIPEPDPDPDPEDQETLEFVRDKKVSAMSAACEAAIVAGFSITDENGDHHFSLQVTDQIMIAQLALKAQAGTEQLPWHADGEPCRFYSPAEIIALNDRMEALITYHQTYFNSLKQYILALGTIWDISQIDYGCDIPEEYQSEVLQVLMKGAAE